MAFLNPLAQIQDGVISMIACIPEHYVEKLPELAMRILRGEPVPPADYTDHVFISVINPDLNYSKS